ncbi:hypothetical protein GCM10028778_23540 [Barrientosiimonas marina]|uniref:Uncharacterized protein n=1 Tax=Lentibacillus kimchii TaxID=1542911 RepID=A0ABW2UVB2_9BACI
MESFSQFRTETEEQLGRRLDDQETAFLCWVYKRYKAEKTMSH